MQDLLLKSQAPLTLRQINPNEVTFRTLEYPRRFVIHGHFNPLDLRASESIKKIEPRLVTQSQLDNSKEKAEAIETITRKLNSQLNNVKEIITGRII
jgi:hypothetical protein